jgi:hypothetical protein
MATLKNRLAKMEQAQQVDKEWTVMPLWGFYGRNCLPQKVDKIGTLSDFFENNCHYCPGCTNDFCIRADIEDIDG